MDTRDSHGSTAYDSPGSRSRARSPHRTGRLGIGTLSLVALLVPFLAVPAAAQNGEPERVRVFLDCQTRGCSQSEFRTEITFVDWVRDRTVADLHVILTSQSAGAGRQFVFDFVGQSEFLGSDLRLTETVSDTDTRDEELAALVRTFKGGLVPYVARRGYLEDLEITAIREGPTGEEPLPLDDPWNLWVFSVGADFEANGEEQQSSYGIGGRLSASRVTPDWKINIGLDGDHEYERYDLTDTTFTNVTDDWEFDVLAVRSISRHWSTGTALEVNTSTRLNRKVGGRGALALEWNLFPYEEANRRQLIFHYQLGLSRVDYEEETIFEKEEETLFDHRLVGVFDNRQPWGNVSFSAEWSNLLHDWGKYRVRFNTYTNIRLFRGFALQLRGWYEVIRDQVYLPAGDLTDEERLVQRRELATGYEYGFDIGFSYRFGSIYNNVVNNRFPWSVL